MAIFSTFVCLVHINFQIYLGLPGSVVPAISVTLGLLLAFRVNTAYDRYTEGRRLFQTVTTTIRNLARLIWLNVPEKNEREHVEKMRCVKLLLAFAVATKRHLRSEYGIDYLDLKSLLPDDWVSTMTSASASTPRQTSAPPKLKTRIAAMMGLRQPILLQDDNEVIPGAEVTGSPIDIASPPILRSHNDDISDIVNKRKDEVDILQQQADNYKVPIISRTIPTRETTTRRSTMTKQNNDNLQLPDTSNVGDVNEQGSSTAASSIKSGSFHSDEDLPEEQDADMCLPMEILFRISLFLNQAKAAGRIESPFVVSCAASIDVLTNSLTAFERIRHTPIPKAYDIHLKQGVVIYVITLPFTLVAEMGFLMIPVVALVAFTLFGVIAIGSQIENPFGYDSNDLPLSHYCEQLKKEVEWVIYHIPTSTESVLLNGA
ncbi:Bestrophin, RFP-TM, chloride channel-domain-containing protein [Umbelopsis sp. PMI_123]|nr:Bestrophin, RFP-TM, chloride channel-domain-containing protein [Umbelopsis sp. PMI_123]